MLKAMSLIFLSTFIYITGEIKLNDKPLKENLLKLSEKFTLMDEEGFYMGTSFSYSENGYYVLLDQGNKTVHVYDSNGKAVRHFGKEGNGPGELMRPFKIFTSKDRIFIRQDMKLNIFDFSGRHIKDVKLISGGSAGTPIKYGDNILIQFSGNTIDKFKVIDKNGKVLSSEKNNEYLPPKAGSDNMSISLSMGFNLVYTGDGFFKSKQGEYKFEFLNTQMSRQKTFTKNFKRIERDPNRYNINVEIDDDALSKKEIARMKAKAILDAVKRMGVYENDISSILGYEKGRLFIRTAQKNLKEMSIDVIENDQLLTQIFIKEKDDIKEVRMENGELLLNLKNKEDGPYVKVYEIN